MRSSSFLLFWNHSAHQESVNDGNVAIAFLQTLESYFDIALQGFSYIMGSIISRISLFSRV